MPIIITAEQKQKAIRLYKNKNLSIKEISNLTDISEARLTVIFRQAFELGILKPRKPEFALKPAVPKGQGKGKYVATGKPAGNPNFRPKYTKEQEREIAQDYYEKGLTTSALKEKWNIHPMQLQAIREKFGGVYGKKKKQNPNKKVVQQFTKSGGFVAEFESGFKASNETGICYVNISKCCNGERPSAGGYVWRFKIEPNLNNNEQTD